MPTIEALCERPKPIAPTTLGSEVFARFEREPDTLIIPVVENDRPIGLIERTVFFEKIAARFGHALYENRPATFVMDAEPAVVEAGVRIDAFCDIMLKGGPAALLRGFVVTRNGLYHGVGTAATLLQGVNERQRAQNRELAEQAAALSDTRTQHDTLAVFGGEYPGGALYSTTAWVNGHEKEVQALTNAIMATLGWIHSHSAEDIMAKMPEDLVGKNKEQYLAALKNTIPMYSETGKMDPKGAEAVLAVFSEGSPEVAKAGIDVTKTYTNRFVDQVKKTTGSAK